MISGTVHTLLKVLSWASTLLFGITFLYADMPRGRLQHLTSPGQVPEGLAKSDWQSIRAAYEEGRHAFQPTATGWQARNPGQQWVTKFDGRGFIAEPLDGAWQWGLELQSYGFGEEQHAIRGTPAVQAAGQRLAYQWDTTVQEWWVNDPRGLEHGFTVARRPAEIINRKSPAERSETGELTPLLFEPIINPLSFTLTTRGTLHPAVSADGQSVLFQDAAGAAVLNYTGLKVWDADGRVLASHFAPAGGSVRLLIEERGARYPLTIDPVAQQAYLKPAAVGTTQAGDTFGYCVGVSGDTVMVSAPQEDSSTIGINSTPNDNNTGTGAVYIFVRSGGAWTQQAYLKPAAIGTTNQNDNFGWSAAISGDTVVVGAWGEDSNTTGVNSTPEDSGAPGFNSGAVYIYVRNAGVWTQQAYLKPASVGTTQGGDDFGYSVAVSGDTIVVGAMNEDSSSTGVNSTPNESAANSGAAYVFVRSAGVWTQQAYLKPAAVGTTQAGDIFGRSVAVSGDTVVVGAASENSSSTGVNSAANESAADSGAAYVFVRSGTNWTQQAYLKPAAVGTTQADDRFGESVSVSGNTIVISAAQEDSSTTGVNTTPNESGSLSGAAYVYVRSGTAWTQQAYLKPGTIGSTQVGDRFGNAVAVSGDTIVVGAYQENSSSTGVNSTANESVAESGAATVFTRTGTLWRQQAYLKPAAVGTTQADDYFGLSVAVDGDTVIVGAMHEDSSSTGVNSAPNESATNAGAAYIYTGLGPPDIALEQPAGTSLSTGATVNFGTVNPGENTPLTFTIRNTGPGDLTGISAGITGADVASFTVSSAPAATLTGPSGSTVFTVRFAPLTSGPKTATLRILSTDSDESPFDITLTGTGLTALEQWRQTHFGTILNAGAAANNADPDLDGLENLVEYAFGLDPGTPGTAELPAWQKDDDTWTLTFTRPANVSGITYVAEYSSSLAPGSWSAAANAGTGNNFVFFTTNTGPRLYLRL